MKAAVLYQYGESPECTEFIDPILNADEVVLKMVASSIKQVDKLKAADKHYTKYPSLPAVVGLDGVARLEDGRAVYITSTKVKFVTIGEMAGASINLPSALLRSRKIALLGSGIGSISFTEVREYFSAELPQAYEWAAKGKIIMPLEIVNLADIAKVWQRKEKKGKRNVVML